MVRCEKGLWHVILSAAKNPGNPLCTLVNHRFFAALRMTSEGIFFMASLQGSTEAVIWFAGHPLAGGLLRLQLTFMAGTPDYWCLLNQARMSGSCSS